MINANKQGGNNQLPIKLYQLALNMMRSKSLIANFGCGEHLAFEKLILSQNNKIKIYSYDITIPKDIPDSINFKCKNLVKPFWENEKFDTITFFELIEHIDETDELLKNIKNNLKPGGELIFSFPNLASIYGRLSLLFGFQPHVLEVSNEYSNFGTGLLGKLSNPSGRPIHHIRGITLKAMIELLKYHGFETVEIIPYEYRLGKLPKIIRSFAPILVIKCKI